MVPESNLELSTQKGSSKINEIINMLYYTFILYKPNSWSLSLSEELNEEFDGSIKKTPSRFIDLIVELLMKAIPVTKSKILLLSC